MFVTTAHAQTAGAASGGGGLVMSLLPILLIFAVFYFLMIRPQQQRIKRHQQMVSQLRRGDKVLTGGGIVGTVARAEGGDEVLVDIADGVRVRVLRSTITDVLNKPVPAGGKSGGQAATERLSGLPGGGRK